jgi:hypothetical protein
MDKSEEAWLEAECARLTEAFRVLALQTGPLRQSFSILPSWTTAKSVNEYCHKVLDGMPTDEKWPVVRGARTPAVTPAAEDTADSRGLPQDTYPVHVYRGPQGTTSLDAPAGGVPAGCNSLMEVKNVRF